MVLRDGTRRGGCSELVLAVLPALPALPALPGETPGAVSEAEVELGGSRGVLSSDDSGELGEVGWLGGSSSAGVAGSESEGRPPMMEMS